MAAFLFLGYRIWPAIFLGAFLFNFSVTGDTGSSLLIALGNTLEGLVGCWLVIRFANGIHAFEKPRSIVQFTIWAGLISTFISATIGVTSLLLFNLTVPEDLFPVWITWWLGDITSNLVFAPFFILWFQRGLKIKGGALEGIALIITLLLVSALVFSGLMHQKYPIAFIIVPVIVWAAYRFGAMASSGAVLFLSIGAIYGTLLGHGPFAMVSPTVSILMLQMFLGIISITTLILAAVEAESKRAKKLFQSMIERSTDAITLINSSWIVQYASPLTFTILHLKPEEFVGQNNFNHVYSEDRLTAINHFTDLLQHPKKILNAETRMIRKDGSIIWVESTSTNMLSDEAVKSVVVNYRDITKYKKTTQSIQEEKARDAALLESIGVGVIATNETGKIIRINMEGKSLLGYTDENLIGKLLVEIFSLQDEYGTTIPISKHPLEGVLDLGEKISTRSFYCLRKNGTPFPIHISIAPIHFKKKMIGAILIFEDITQERDIDKAKTEFIALASHQLRTPLSIIKWLSEILSTEGKNGTHPIQKQHLEEIQSATTRMINLVNRLLNVSRLELSTLTVESKHIDIQQIIDIVLHELRPYIQKKSIVVQKKIISPEVKLKADPNLIHIVLQNIISNAIKYSPDKSVIQITLEKKQDEVEVMIQDQGIGIPKNQQQKIFNKLFRTSIAKEMDPDGTGLGLYIVKSIMQAMEGKITFESTEGIGTTFRLSFPDEVPKKEGGSTLIVN